MSRFIIRSNEPIEALSISQMNSFLRCRKQWWYGYVKKIRPRREARPLTLGKLIHEGMAAYWTSRAHGGPIGPEAGLEAMRRSCDQQRIQMEGDEWDVFEDILRNAEEVFLRALTAFDPSEWEVVLLDSGEPLVEVHFAVPLVRRVPMQGFIDLVARDLRTGMVWQIDWKFVSSLSDAEDELFNLQNVVYQYALRRIGVEVAGSITFKCLSKESTKPKMNKNGSLSRAYIRCSWEDYARACIEAGENPEDYREEMEPKLAQNQWTLKVQEYRNEETLINLWREEIAGTAHEILKNQTRYPRSVSPMNCRTCSYRSICHGELRGYDVEGIEAMEYEPKRTREEENSILTDTAEA